MNELFVTYLRETVALFVILNPIGVLPTYLSISDGIPPDARRKIPKITALWCAAVLIVSVLGGAQVLQFFGISIASFQVGGGVVLLMMAFSMLQAQPSRTKHTPEEAEDAQTSSSIAVVPLGTPLIAGPGTISTATVYGNETGSWYEMAILIGCCLLLSGLVYIILTLADRIGARLGRTGVNIVSRLQGLILCAIAFEIIAAGLSTLLPGLARAAH